MCRVESRCAIAIVVRPDQIIQCLLYLFFGFSIHRCSRLIQDQDTRIDQQCPCNGDALAFSARQTLAALPHKRVIPVRQAQNEFMRVCSSRRCDDFCAARIRFAIGDIFGNRPEEQERFLQYQSDIAAVFPIGRERMFTPSMLIEPSLTS